MLIYHATSSHTNMYLFAKKDFTLAVTVLYETEAD